jgi:TolB-like protein
VKFGNLFVELKRRNVYKVAVAYAVVAWLLVQVATQVFPFLEIPNWVVRLVIALVAIGFPIALVIAWAFEATAEGIKRTEVADAMPAASVGHKKHAWIYIIVIAGAASAALFFLGRYTAGDKTAAAASNELPAKSIAVLPFENLSRDPDNSYFAEGIQDEILTRLSKIAALKVISRSSTQKYKSAPGNSRDVGKQLGVANLLEGSVQKVGNAVHISVQLIRAATDEHVWAESYNRTLDDVFAVEAEVASAIAEQLNAKLTGAEQKPLQTIRLRTPLRTTHICAAFPLIPAVRQKRPARRPGRTQRRCGWTRALHLLGRGWRSHEVTSTSTA